MKNKVLGKCPACGGDTVIEEEKSLLGTLIKIERCDNLIAIHDDKPLQACTWFQELNVEPIHK